MSKPVAVTGATGFVGRHVVDALLAGGHAVRVLVRDRSKQQVGSEKIETVVGDLNEAGALEQLVSGVSAIIHCAGAIAALDRGGFYAVNEVGAENVAKAAKSAGVERLVHVSTLAARQPELSFYASSKRAGESAVEKVFGRSGLTIVRPPAVYGPTDRATLPLIKSLTQRWALLPTPKKQKVSLIYVDDLAALLVSLAVGPAGFGGVCEVDDGKAGGYGWDEIAALAGKAQQKRVGVIHLPRGLVYMASLFSSAYGRLVKKPVILSPRKVNELYHADWMAKSAKIDGWVPKVQFEHGFVRTLSWYLRNGWLPGGDDKAKRLTNSGYGEPVK